MATEETETAPAATEDTETVPPAPEETQAAPAATEEAPAATEETEETEEKVKWGILSTADIARKFCAAMPNASNATIVAVASRDKAKAEAFIAANCPDAKAYGSYEELLNDPEVQAVYIPLPTAVRPEWIFRAAGKKKHILCEKPISGKAKDAHQIIQSCSAAGVQFMDNTMFMHHERTAAIRETLDDKELFGTPYNVSSKFSLPFGLLDEWATNNVRMKREAEPLGCLGDLGWYCVRVSLWAFGYDEPEQVSCHFLDQTKDGVPLHVVATLLFSGNRTATFECSFKHGVRQWVEIQSEKACLRMEDFVIPNKVDTCSFTVTKEMFADKASHVPVETVLKHEIEGCCQELKLIEKFSSLVLKGERDPLWPKIALQTQLLMNALVSAARSPSSKVIAYMSKAGGNSKGKGKGKGKEVKKTKPVVSNVEVIEPDGKNLNLEVKVVSVGAASSAVVGDATGCVVFLFNGEAQMSLFKEGASLVIRNAYVKMADGFINLVVDKWGKVEVSSEPFTFTPKAEINISETEYELVQA